MKGNMTEGNPFSLIIRFSIPLLLGNLFQQTYNMVDAAIVGRRFQFRTVFRTGICHGILCRIQCSGVPEIRCQRLFGNEKVCIYRFCLGCHYRHHHDSRNLSCL